MTPLNQRRLEIFKSNRRGVWSLRIFLGLFVVSLFAEFIANDKPIVFSYENELYFPMLFRYMETDLGGRTRVRGRIPRPVRHRPH